MVTTLFIVALCSFAVMAVFLWALTVRHRRRQQADSRPPVSPGRSDGDRLG